MMISTVAVTAHTVAAAAALAAAHGHGLHHVQDEGQEGGDEDEAVEDPEGDDDEDHLEEDDECLGGRVEHAHHAQQRGDGPLHHGLGHRVQRPLHDRVLEIVWTLDPLQPYTVFGRAANEPSEKAPSNVLIVS